jgi:predicted transcriptional regulator of viral defense system
VDHVVHKSATTVTLQGLQEFLEVPVEAASRILCSLEKAGIVHEVRDGVWARVNDLPSPY